MGLAALVFIGCGIDRYDKFNMSFYQYTKNGGVGFIYSSIFVAADRAKDYYARSERLDTRLTRKLLLPAKHKFARDEHW
jgi:hypothetical protein